MSYDKCEIKHSENGEYYTMLIDGEFAGNYSTMSEAAQEFDHMRQEAEEDGDIEW